MLFSILYKTKTIKLKFTLMKKLFSYSIALLGAIAIMVGVTSCETKQGITISFNQDNEQIVTILPNSILRTDTTVNITSSLDSILAANNATRDDIESITLASVDVDVCDSLGNIYPSGVNFNEWDTVGVRVFVPNDNTVPDVLVAKTSVPRNVVGFGVGLTQDDFDFIPYASKQQFAVRLLGVLNSPILAKKYVKVRIRVNIAANI